MAKGKGFLETVLSGVRMNDDDFYESDGEFDEEDGEEEDERDFVDSDSESKLRFRLNLGGTKKNTSARKTRTERYDSDGEKEDSYSEEADKDFYDSEPEEEKSTLKTPFSSGKTAKKSSKVTPLRRTHANQSYSSEVRVLHPMDMEQASAIGDALLDEAVVVLNLEGLDLDLAQRIIDFSSGCIYALGANLHKVTEYFFVIAPSSIEITGDMKSIMRGAAPSMRAEY